MAPFATRDDQKQIIYDCFNGHMDRDCETCPAFHSRTNGICCFGDPEEYDEDDDDCESCPHNEDCATAVVELLAAREEAEIEKEALRQAYLKKPSRVLPIVGGRPISRPTTTTTRPGGYFSSSSSSSSSSGSTTWSRTRMATRPATIEKLADGETLFERFLKDSIWGAGEGFFQRAAEFFHSHRLP